MLDRDLEDARIHYPPDPGLCPWCGKDWNSDHDNLPTCCEDGREFAEDVARLDAETK